VPVDVEVVIGALADALGLLQLGEDDGGDPQLVEEREAAERVGAAEELAQLGQLALAGGLGGAGGAPVGERDGLGVDLQVQLGGEAGGAQEPQRVLLEAARADGAEHAAFEVDETA
jgi:hypothetical protein